MKRKRRKQPLAIVLATTRKEKDAILSDEGAALHEEAIMLDAAATILSALRCSVMHRFSKRAEREGDRLPVLTHDREESFRIDEAIRFLHWAAGRRRGMREAMP